MFFSSIKDFISKKLFQIFFISIVNLSFELIKFIANMKFDADTPLDSYSLAAMARTEDILSFLVEDLDVVGSKDAYKNILYGVRLIVEGKNRRLSDFSEIINEEEEEENSSKKKSLDSFRINIFRENLIDDIISIIKQNGFKQVNRIVNSTHILIKIPEPTQNQLNEFAGETKRIERSAISRIARIKSDAIQRIKAALEREYIEPHVAVPAKAHLENIQQSAVSEIRLIGLKKRKTLLGRFFSYTDEEEKKLGKKLEKSPHNNLFSN
jgi:ribosome recycling factor